MDIAMCENSKCPKAQDCYRFTATPDEWRQTYILIEEVGDDCKHFWDNRRRASDDGGGE